MHPNDGRVVSNFVVQALSGRPITIYGDGSQTRSFCYVDDMIAGFRALMDSPDEVTGPVNRSEEHTSELQSLMRISYAVFCLQKKTKHHNSTRTHTRT